MAVRPHISSSAEASALATIAAREHRSGRVADAPCPDAHLPIISDGGPTATRSCGLCALSLLPFRQQWPLVSQIPFRRLAYDPGERDLFRRRQLFQLAVHLGRKTDRRSRLLRRAPRFFRGRCHIISVHHSTPMWCTGKGRRSGMGRASRRGRGWLRSALSAGPKPPWTRAAEGSEPPFGDGRAHVTDERAFR